MQDAQRKSPMSRRGKSPSSERATPRKRKSPNIYDFDGLLSSTPQLEIKTLLTLPALPCTDNNYLENEWIELASCKSQTAKFFRHACSRRCDTHPDGCTRVKSVRDCRAVCAVCPVLEHCRLWSIHTNLTHGIAGGLTESERLAIRQELQLVGEEEHE